MRKSLLLTAALLALCSCEKQKPSVPGQDSGPFIIAPGYRVTDQRNGYEVGITCTNGGDPTVVGNFDGMLMISCGK